MCGLRGFLHAGSGHSELLVDADSGPGLCSESPPVLQFGYESGWLAYDVVVLLAFCVVSSQFREHCLFN